MLSLCTTFFDCIMWNDVCRDDVELINDYEEQKKPNKMKKILLHWKTFHNMSNGKWFFSIKFFFLSLSLTFAIWFSTIFNRIFKRFVVANANKKKWKFHFETGASKKWQKKFQLKFTDISTTDNKNDGILWRKFLVSLFTLTFTSRNFSFLFDLMKLFHAIS